MDQSRLTKRIFFILYNPMGNWTDDVKRISEELVVCQYMNRKVYLTLLMYKINVASGEKLIENQN